MQRGGSRLCLRRGRALPSKSSDRAPACALAPHPARARHAARGRPGGRRGRALRLHARDRLSRSDRPGHGDAAPPQSPLGVPRLTRLELPHPPLDRPLRDRGLPPRPDRSLGSPHRRHRPARGPGSAARLAHRNPRRRLRPRLGARPHRLRHRLPHPPGHGSPRSRPHAIPGPPAHSPDPRASGGAPRVARARGRLASPLACEVWGSVRWSGCGRRRGCGRRAWPRRGRRPRRRRGRFQPRPSGRTGRRRRC